MRRTHTRERTTVGAMSCYIVAQKSIKSIKHTTLPYRTVPYLAGELLLAAESLRDRLPTDEDESSSRRATCTSSRSFIRPSKAAITCRRGATSHEATNRGQHGVPRDDMALDDIRRIVSAISYLKQ